MKGLILFSKKNKKNISLSSVAFAHTVIIAKQHQIDNKWFDKFTDK